MLEWLKKEFQAQVCTKYKSQSVMRRQVTAKVIIQYVLDYGRCYLRYFLRLITCLKDLSSINMKKYLVVDAMMLKLKSHHDP